MGSSESEIRYQTKMPPTPEEVEQIAHTFEVWAGQIRQMGPAIVSVGGYFRNTRIFHDICADDFVDPPFRLTEVDNELDFHFEIRHGRM